MDLALDTNKEDLSLRNPKKLMLWIAMASMFMIFSGLSSAMFVTAGDAERWMEFELPSELTISTILLVLSSVTMGWAVYSAKRNHLLAVKIGTLITFLLGIGFTLFQLLAWKAFYANGVILINPDNDVSMSYMYIVTGLHMLHLIGGLISLLYVFIASLKNRYKVGNVLGLELSATYWHFLDVLWLLLFIFLVFIR